MLFDASTDNTASSFHGILENSNTTTSPPKQEQLLSPYACVEEGSWLVQTAMRCKERDSSEEKWVCSAEVGEEIKEEQEEVSSCCCATADHQHHQHHVDLWWKDLGHERRSGGSTSLLLKLGYQEIPNARSDKGPL